MLQTNNVRSIYFTKGKFRTSLMTTSREPTSANDFFYPTVSKHIISFHFIIYGTLNKRGLRPFTNISREFTS